MADYASITGGNAPDTLVGERVDPAAVGQDWNAYYYIETADVFIDRFDSLGDSVVDVQPAAGPVRLELGGGSDWVSGGSGSDTIWTGAGSDTVTGGGGDNVIASGAGSDLVVGGDGKDSIVGGEGVDTIRAGIGDDYVVGGNGADSIRGEDGNDSLFGASGDDSLHGQEGADRLVGGSGADLLLGGAGDDTLFGGSGGDVFAFDDGFGRDVINDFGPGDQINLAANLNGTGIASAADLVDMGMVTGGTTAAGTKFTVITVGQDTIRLEKIDHTDFINQIGSWVQVG